MTFDEWWRSDKVPFGPDATLQIVAQAAWRASALACAAACEQYVTHSEVNKAHECEDECRMIAEGK